MKKLYRYSLLAALSLFFFLKPWDLSYAQEQPFLDVSEATFTVTFQVDMEGVPGFEPENHDVYIAGSMLGWAGPGDDPDGLMTPVSEGSDIYTVTFSLEAGEYEYKYFIVEDEPSWDWGEWIGEPNRTVDITEGKTFSDVWGDAPSQEVTLQVDMRFADGFNPESHDVYISGNVLDPEWPMPGDDPNALMAPVSEGSDVYTITFDLAPGEYMYKYFIVAEDPSWDWGEWVGDPNRVINVTGPKTALSYWSYQPGQDVPLTARAQIIHNSADPAASVVDIYVNDDLFVSELAFREATPFEEVPAETPLKIDVYPHGADPLTEDPAFTADEVVFADRGTIAVIANGVLEGGFASNPEDNPIDFALYLVDAAKETHDPASEAGIYIWHGATDAPSVDIWVVDGPVLAEGAEYTNNTANLGVNAQYYDLRLGPEGSFAADEGLFDFAADLSGAGGLGVGILASGFLDPSANKDGESFALLTVLPDGSTSVLEAVPTGSEVASEFPDVFRLEQNYPNPFNPATTISFSLPEASDVTLEVYTIQGRRVATLVDSKVEAGMHSVQFDATALASGIYLYRMTAGDITFTQKMSLIK